MGARVATSAMEAAEKPLKAPMRARRLTSCQSAADRPISAMKMAMAKLERSTMSLRPVRSAIEPQSGDTAAEIRKLTELSTPDQKSMVEGSCRPRSCR